ncbi:MAG: DUF4124 domain-containing protein [gamma proteobacterium endosymbiont of Lamellibrachia anaximandri]|nr:DUF4124 domain-containing protein [gamma proteobacterium endosymbiont of Lamellibrachia anaximandri]MBL3534298.1 DUF4124 domain-containing protein [gamma proteobacterium endosymbiont of Lamellibrachia anaximandri]
MRHLSQWTVVFITGLLIIPCTQAGIYKWVDEAGRTHYSDRPLAENRQEIELRTSPSNETPPPIRNDRKATRQRMLDIYREERAAHKEAKKKAQQKKAERKARCKDARSRLESYTTAGSIYDYSEERGRRYFSYEERERFIEQLKADVAQWCRK